MSIKRNTILYTQGNYEFYRNDDGKMVSQLKDQCKDYRRSELLPEVNELLDELRSYRSGYPTEANINSIIKMQEEHPDKAINYIKYRYFGSATYLMYLELKPKDDIKSSRTSSKMSGWKAK
jgi:hypothetical protein